MTTPDDTTAPDTPAKPASQRSEALEVELAMLEATLPQVPASPRRLGRVVRGWERFVPDFGATAPSSHNLVATVVPAPGGFTSIASKDWPATRSKSGLRMRKDVLGEFEHHVMLAALRIGDGAYTTAIVLELETRTGREVAPAAVYIALRRLEQHGLVRSEYGVDEDTDRRERRYFSVTRAGLRLLRESRRRFVQLWDGLEPVLKEGH